MLTPVAIAQESQVPRHPSVFEGAPIVEGYRLVPAGLAPFYFRAVSEALRVLAYYNLTDISIVVATCDLSSLPTGHPYWRAEIAGYNSGLGAMVVYSTPLSSSASLWKHLELVSSENISAILRPSPDTTLLRIASTLDNASLRLIQLAYTGIYYNGNRSLSPGVSIVVSLTGWTPDPAEIVQAALGQSGVRVSQTFYTLGVLNMTPSGVTSITLWYPCRPLNASSLVPLEVPGAALALETTNTSGAALILEALAATPSNITIGSTSLVVAQVPVINPEYLSAAAARGVLGALEPINETITAPEPPVQGVNVTIEEIRSAIANGSEVEALRAIREAQGLVESGALSPQDLEELRRLFMERFGYDPLGEGDGGGGQGGAASRPSDVYIDINNLLDSLQSLTGGQAPAAIGPGRAQLPSISVELPGARESLTAALVASAAATAGLLYTSRREIAFTVRALAARPPSGMTPAEMAEWCYAAALRVLELRGLGRLPWETPREYLARVSPLLGPLAEALERLTAAYELAAYRGESPPRGESIRACRAIISRARNPLWRPEREAAQ